MDIKALILNIKLSLYYKVFYIIIRVNILKFLKNTQNFEEL